MQRVKFERAGRCSGFLGEGRVMIRGEGKRSAWPMRVLMLGVFIGSLCSVPAALPKRLVLALDGISFRHMQALQEGILLEDSRGRRTYRKAFDRGYYPVSRLVSTFPSATDVAWTEIFGNRPLPGYQRTYYSRQANTMVVVNGVSSSMEFERQMTWRMEGGFRHAMSYLFPSRVFKCELADFHTNFLRATNSVENFYAYICCTDGAQHMGTDIFRLMCAVDEELEQLREICRQREHRELEILILSDHGNNQGGGGKRVRVRGFLQNAGYRVCGSITRPRDVVLPTVGIESWVEVHNAPAQTQALVELLAGMEGVDVLSGKVSGVADRFVVMNSRREKAFIDWRRRDNAFRYTMVRGDPLGYGPALSALQAACSLDSDGFAPADAWMQQTLRHAYPLALERIARGHSTVTLNPATILISLKCGYVHADYAIKKGSELLRCGGTHGGLDELSSTGILLSNFRPTHDTSTSRVARLFGGFTGLRDYRAEETGAEWITTRDQSLVAVQHVALDGGRRVWQGSAELLLRLWTPRLANAGNSVELTFRKLSGFAAPLVRNGDPDSARASERRLTLKRPIPIDHPLQGQRVYAIDPHFRLEPLAAYRLYARSRGAGLPRTELLTFRTDARGLPISE